MNKVENTVWIVSIESTFYSALSYKKPTMFIVIGWKGLICIEQEEYLEECIDKKNTPPYYLNDNLASSIRKMLSFYLTLKLTLKLVFSIRLNIFLLNDSLFRGG